MIGAGDVAVATSSTAGSVAKIWSARSRSRHDPVMAAMAEAVAKVAHRTGNRAYANHHRKAGRRDLNAEHRTDRAMKKAVPMSSGGHRSCCLAHHHDLDWARVRPIGSPHGARAPPAFSLISDLMIGVSSCMEGYRQTMRHTIIALSNSILYSSSLGEVGNLCPVLIGLGILTEGTAIAMCSRVSRCM